MIDPATPFNQNPLIRTGSEGDKVWLDDSEHQIRHELNQNAVLIWNLCDGNNNLPDIVEKIVPMYQGEHGVSKDIYGTLSWMLRKRLIFQKKQGIIAEKPDSAAYVGQHRPSMELLWALEQARQFIFGVIGTTGTGQCAHLINLENDGLLRAKELDLDKARHAGDSEVVRLGKAFDSESYTSVFATIIRELEKQIPDLTQNLAVSGRAYYSPGRKMGWHSNYSSPGMRIYCSWCEKPGENFFRYEDPETKEIVTLWESPGWNIKSFVIPELPDRLWHCISAESKRLAFGFKPVKTSTDGSNSEESARGPAVA